VALGNGFVNSNSERILDTKDSDGGKISLEAISVVLTSEVIMFSLKCVIVCLAHNFVGGQNSSESLMSEGQYGSIQNSLVGVGGTSWFSGSKELFWNLNFIGLVNSPSIGVNDVSSQWENHVWGTLAENDDVTIMKVNNLRSSLSLGLEWNGDEVVFIVQFVLFSSNFWASKDVHEEFENTLFSDISSSDVVSWFCWWLLTWLNHLHLLIPFN